MGFEKKIYLFSTKSVHCVSTVSSELLSDIDLFDAELTSLATLRILLAFVCECVWRCVHAPSFPKGTTMSMGVGK